MFRLVPDPQSQRNVDHLAQFFNTLGLRIGGEKGAIEEVIIQGFQANFRNEGSGAGAWAQLAPATIRERAWHGFSSAHPILYRTGSYYDSLVDPANSDHFAQGYTSSNSFALEVGSESRLFPWHERGTPTMPARSVTDLSSQSERRLGDEITAMLNRLIGKEGL